MIVLEKYDLADKIFCWPSANRKKVTIIRKKGILYIVVKKELTVRLVLVVEN